jgi:hypothetical protein
LPQLPVAASLKAQEDMKLARRILLFASLGALIATISGCVALFLPDTYEVAQSSNLVSPFKHILVDGGSDDGCNISLEDPDSSKLKHLRFVSGTVTNEAGMVTQLRLRREILGNPNSFSMVFYEVGYRNTGVLQHDSRFRICLRSYDELVVVTFQVRFKEKVHWPSDSDYSG